MPKPVNIKPKPAGQIRPPVRPGTKIATLVNLLRRKQGASFQQISAALSQWGAPVPIDQVSTWLHYDLHTLKGYGVRSKIQRNGTIRCYLIDPTGGRLARAASGLD